MSLFAPARLAPFALTGVCATLLYVGVATLLTGFLSAALASACAYAMGALVTYCGNRLLTFRSAGRVAREVPRFLLTGLAGYSLALALPFVLTQTLHHDPRIAIAAVCVLVPPLNFILLALFVFADKGRPAENAP